MGTINYVSPGAVVTLTEYDSNFTTIYNEFNGSIDNANIKAAAGIIDTKLATISTEGKISDSALPSTVAGKTFSTGITIQTGGVTVDAGGITVTLGGATITGGVTIVDVGLTVTAGGITLTTGGLDVASGNLVDIKGVNGIDYNNGGGDADIDITTIQVTGVPKQYWDESENRFASTVGLKVDTGGVTIIGGASSFTGGLTLVDVGLIVTAGPITVTAGGVDINGGGLTVTGGVTIDNIGLTITTGGLTVTAGGILLTAGGLDIVSGNAVLIKGINGIDYNTGGGDTDIDIVTTIVDGNPRLYWDESEDQYAVTTGFKLDSGDLDLISGNAILTSGNLTLSSGNIVVSGTVDGIDIDALATSVTNHAVTTTVEHGTPIAFNVHKNGTNQTVATGTSDITWSTEDFDIGAAFASNVHTPQESGKYWYYCQVGVTETGTVNPIAVALRLSLNGVDVIAIEAITIAASGYAILTIGWLAEMNGSTDNMKAKLVKTGTGVCEIDGTITRSRFYGFKQLLS